MIVACYHPLTLPACMLHFDLVSHFNPYILQHFSENVFTRVITLGSQFSDTIIMSTIIGIEVGGYDLFSYLKLVRDIICKI